MEGMVGEEPGLRGPSGSLQSHLLPALTQSWLSFDAKSNVLAHY